MLPYLHALAAHQKARKMVIQWESRVGLARFQLKRCQRDALRRYPAPGAEQVGQRWAYCLAATEGLQQAETALEQARQHLAATAGEVQRLTPSDSAQ